MTKEELIADIKRKCGERYSVYFNDPNIYDEECLIKYYEIATGKRIEESSSGNSDKDVCADMIIDAYLNEEL